MARIKTPKAEAPAVETTAAAAPQRTAPSVEFWEGGDVRVQNIGPIRGERLLGTISGPGLYRFVAPNANGKTTLLELLRRIQNDKLLRSEANVTHGELSAFLEIGASRVTFRKTGASGTMEPMRSGTERLPKIESIPSPIDTLITGNNLKGEEPRAKARLEALLTYVPVEADEKRLALLADSMNPLAVAINAYPGALATAREWLAEQAATGKIRGIGGVTFETEADVRAWLTSRQNEGILDAQQSLLDRLNAFGNAAEHALEAGKRRMAAAFGRADELEPKRGGLPIPILELDKLPTLEEAEIAQRGAENAAAESRVSYRHRIDEGARREQVRATIGEAVDLAPLRAASERARVTLEQKTAAADAARIVLAGIDATQAKRAEQEAREWVSREATNVLDLITELRGAGLDDAAATDEFDAGRTAGALARFRTRIAPSIEVAEKRIDAWAVARADADSIGERREAAQEEYDALEEEEKEARVLLAEAQDRLSAGERAVTARATTLAALDAPLTGATAEDVQQAEEEAAAARQTTALAAARAKYRLALSDASSVAALVESVSALASAYRASAAATWEALGFLVTEAVNVPFLRVAGLRIFIGYVAQPGRVDGRLAGAEEAPGSVEWRNLDDSEMISTAELNQAILRLMLSRRSELGGILILPWQVVGALDDDRARVFSAEAEAAGLVVISERPRRDSDPQDGIFLEKIEAAK